MVQIIDGLDDRRSDIRRSTVYKLLLFIKVSINTVKYWYNWYKCHQDHEAHHTEHKQVNGTILWRPSSSNLLHPALSLSLSQPYRVFSSCSPFTRSWAAAVCCLPSWSSLSSLAICSSRSFKSCRTSLRSACRVANWCCKLQFSATSEQIFRMKQDGRQF